MGDTISVIMTVRNEGQNISPILDSLLNQTVSFNELVINDNGSTDNTLNVIREYQKSYAKIKLIESRNQSIGRGRNVAIEHSSGEILAIMDAGICPENDWLKQVTSPFLVDPELEVVWGNIIFDTKSRVIPSTDIGRGLVFLTKYPENRQQGRNVPSSAFRRQVWVRLGKFPEIDLPIEDLLLIERIGRGGFKAVWVKDAIAYYFKYPTSYLRVFKKWIISVCSAFMVRRSELGFLKQIMRFSLFFIFILLAFFNAWFCLAVVIYILTFFVIKYRFNVELGKMIMKNPVAILTTFNLFFIINCARVAGVLKAIGLIISGKNPPILYNDTGG